MTEHNITLAVGTTKVLHTAGQYCDRDIVVTAENGDGYDKGYNDGIEAGKQAEYDAFWDSLQQNGKRTDYVSTFGAGWNDDIFKPKYDLKPNDATTMFERSNIIDLKGDLERAGVELDFSGVTYGRFTQIFASSQVRYVGEVDTRGSATNTINYLFYAASYLINIEKLIMTADGTQKFNETNTFAACTSLEEIRLEGLLGCSLSFKDCQKLSNDSVQSIIDHLKDLTGATAQTLTFHATVGGNMTEAQKTAISQKNWQLVY